MKKMGRQCRVIDFIEYYGKSLQGVIQVIMMDSLIIYPPTDVSNNVLD